MRFLRWLCDWESGYGLLGLLAIIFVVWAAAMLIFFNDEEGTPTPYGCAWVDMNPSKGADYQLACIEGHDWNND